jgi:xanthine dehydrogenase accessory factor
MSDAAKAAAGAAYTHHEWLAVLSDLAARGTPCVLITVLEAKGSTPRDAGTKMVVTSDRQFGTIGGGNLEFQAIGEARKLLEAAGGTTVKDYPLGPALAQCCGGAVTVLLEPVFPPGKTLLLFGAGHVGKEVVRVLEGLPAKIMWVDERAGEFPAGIPAGCEKVHTSDPAGEIKRMPAGAFIIVMTHSHDLDYEIVKAVMARGDFAYLGLIGSDTKRARFEKKLLADGIKKDTLARLTCPIGIPAVTGKHPREIAVAVAAEILGLGLTRAGNG